MAISLLIMGFNVIGKLRLDVQHHFEHIYCLKCVYVTNIVKVTEM